MHPELLSKHQAYVAKETGSSEKKPVFLVFHGGSGSTPEEVRDLFSDKRSTNPRQFKEAISYGVVKVNIDTDTQVSTRT